ncbi:hypothetical protein vseg_004560 [Gypsophila vaccaria]
MAHFNQRLTLIFLIIFATGMMATKGDPLHPLTNCTANAGACSFKSCDDNCCNARCQAKWPSGTGSCEDMPGTALRLCLCTYDC